MPRNKKKKDTTRQIEIDKVITIQNKKKKDTTKQKEIEKVITIQNKKKKVTAKKETTKQDKKSYHEKKVNG